MSSMSGRGSAAPVWVKIILPRSCNCAKRVCCLLIVCGTRNLAIFRLWASEIRLAWLESPSEQYVSKKARVSLAMIARMSLVVMSI